MKNTIATVVYVHGRFGSPWFGGKIMELRPIALKCGFNIISYAYNEADDVVTMQKQLINQCTDKVQVPGDLVLLASSRGAYVAIKASFEIAKTLSERKNRVEGDKKLPPQNLLGIFLLAPAVNIKPEYYPDQNPLPTLVPTAIIHGFNDDIIHYKKVVDFAEKIDAQLTLVKAGHRLNSQLELLKLLFTDFLNDRMEESQESLDRWTELGNITKINPD